MRSLQRRVDEDLSRSIDELVLRHLPGPRQQRAIAIARHVLAIAVVLAASLAPTELMGLRWSTPLTATLVVLTVVAVTLRSRWPRSIAAAVLVLLVAGILADGPVTAHLAAVLIVLFSLASRTDRRTALLGALIAFVTVSLSGILLLPELWHDVRTTLQIATFIGLFTAAGDAARSRRAFIDAIADRARRAEETKEAEAQQRVAEERLRIARDLHDVMAHQIAVINLHAGVASAALPDRPADAQTALSTVREAARTVLSEMGGLLSVLRAGGPESTAPVAGLSELDALLAEFARGGLRVERRSVGTARALPEPVDIVAYRVVQEALTNAHKHGADRSALLHLEWQPEALEITVTNTIGESPNPAPGGHGLLGVRERLASIDGSLSTAFGPGPVHRFVAVLPDAHPEPQDGTMEP